MVNMLSDNPIAILTETQSEVFKYGLRQLQPAKDLDEEDTNEG